MDNRTKVLGGVGALLIVLSFIPYLGLLFGLAGFILLFIALKKASEAYKDRGIFKNFLKGFLVSFLGFLVAGIFAGFAVGAHRGGESSVLSVGFLVVAFLLFYVSTVVSVAFYRRALYSLADFTGNDLFMWAGRLFFWGGITTIIVIGSLVMWVGWVLLTVAFFTAEEKGKGEEQLIEREPRG
ncbi:putative membrane protein [Phorcysia thermohydrogeniphila]|uniref:Putative membrane protein n=2 Tax=Phorcysia thermohydrogeniphila TaxID=936138 RepID=A0A4R1G9M8_9BACT|nr:putative membrane protein [Phorcysia thermohydrogeniphila]